MKTKCVGCINKELVQAKNQIGSEVQDFALPEGWVAPDSQKFKTCCEACDALEGMIKTTVEHRVDATLI